MAIGSLRTEILEQRMGVLERLDRLADAFTTECERSKLRILCGFSILYLVTTGLLASRKLMWNDELYTFYISRLHSTSDIWAALLTGADQVPPFFHLINRASFTLFGVNHLSIRLPEVIGVWVMTLCLFHVVSKRSSALYGLAGMLFPLVTFVYDYAYEARPYGLVLGFAGLSLVSWQSAVEGTYRKISLMGLGLSLAAGLSSHYYAVLLWGPLVFGEIVRSLHRRQLDFPIWITFGLALTPLLLFLPLISQSKLYSINFWSQPEWELVPGFFYFLLLPTSSPVVAWLIISALWFASKPGEAACVSECSRLKLPVHEVAAALGFVAMPALGVLLAKLVVGVFAIRYALPAVIGLSSLFALAAYKLLYGRAIMGVTLVVTLLVWLGVMQVMYFRQTTAVSVAQDETYKFLRSVDNRELPIVVADPHTFMKLAHYAPPDLASRFVYLAAPEVSQRYLGHNTADRGMLDLNHWFQLRVEPFDSYLVTHQQFLLHARFFDTHGKLWSRGQLSGVSWLLSELTRVDRRIELLSRNADDLLFLVSRDERHDAIANIASVSLARSDLRAGNGHHPSQPRRIDAIGQRYQRSMP